MKLGVLTLKKNGIVTIKGHSFFLNTECIFCQGSVCAEVAPGAPQEISSASSNLDGLDVRELKSR